MDAGELAGIVDALITDCEDETSAGEAKRTRALDFFRGKMAEHVPSDEGRSSMTSRDVRSVIKKVLPSIKRVIMGSDQVVEYKPGGRGDEQIAKQATQYVNKIVVPEANVEDAISDAIMSALLLDEGVLTWWFEQRQRIAVTRHSGLTDDEMMALGQDPNVEVLESSSYEASAEGMQFQLWQARIKRVLTEPRFRVEAIPVENFLMHPSASSVDDSPIVGHKMMMRRSDLVARGFDRDLVESLSAETGDFMDVDRDRDSRNPDDEITATSGNALDGPLENIEVFRVFVRVDADDDGIAELREVWFARSGGSGGGTILFEDYADEVQYAPVVIERIMHSWRGMSVFDDVEDLQVLKTVLFRQTLDNLYASNNPQPVMQAGTVLNPGAVFSPEFGQPIQIRAGVPASEAVHWQTVPFIAEKSMGMIQRADADIVDRTGITSAAGGLDPMALQNVREQGVQMISDAASAQAWCMVRELARGGLKRLFRGILRMVVEHQDKPRQVQIDDEWIDFDPRSWRSDLDCEVNVGLGTGTKERDMAALSVVAGYQEKIIAAFGPANPFVSPKQLGETLQAIAETAGLRSPERHFSVPSDDQAAQITAPKQSPEEMKLQAQMQLEQAKMSAARDKETAQAQADVMVEEERRRTQEAAAMAEMAQRQADRESRERIEMAKLEATMTIEREKMMANMAKIAPAMPEQQFDDVGQPVMSETETAITAIRDLAAQIAAMQSAMLAPKVVTTPDGRTFTMQAAANA